MAGPNSWRTIWKLILRAARKPGAVIQSFRWTHVKTLLYALRHEPPSLILYNFTQLLIGGKRHVTHHENLLIDEEGLKVYLDHLYHSDRKVELSGWCLSADKELTDLKLLQGKQEPGAIETGLHRPDLLAKHGPAFERTGFHAVLPVSPDQSTLSLQLFFADGEVRSIDLPNPSQEERYEALVIMEPDLHPSATSIKRFLRKHKRDLPPIHLKATPQQWKVLQQPDYPFDISLYSPKNLRKGDWVLQLAPEVEPSRDLLWQVGKALADAPQDCSLVYWDEDTLMPSGKRVRPQLKPDFDLDYLLSWNYIGPNLAYRYEGVPAAVSKLQHPLRVLPLNPGRTSGLRIPFVLSHWLKISSPSEDEEKRARKDFLSCHASGSSLEEGLLPATFRIRYPLIEHPAVTILIPFRDGVSYLKKCLESLDRYTRYPNVHVLLIDNQSTDVATLEYVDQMLQKHDHIRRMIYDHPFNYAAIHEAAMEQVETPYVLLLNNDIEAIEYGWLEAMMEYAQQERVGAVGAKLLYPDRTLQHVGVVVGIGGAADHAFKHLEEWAAGYLNQAQVAKQWAACTAACLLLRKDRWLEVGGMDTESFPIAFNDVDLCLKLRRAGYDIVYTPFAKLIHHESVSRGKDLTRAQRDRASREIRAFQKQWEAFLKDGDPHYHPAFSIRSAHFELA